MGESGPVTEEMKGWGVVTVDVMPLSWFASNRTDQIHVLLPPNPDSWETNTPTLSFLYATLAKVLRSVRPHYFPIFVFVGSHLWKPMETSLMSHFNRFRSSANSFLSQYEPIVLLVSPLLAFLLAHTIRSFFELVHDKGLKPTLLGFFMSSIK